MKKNNNKELKELFDSTKLAIKYGHGYPISETATWIEYNGALYKINLFYELRTRDMSISINDNDKDENQNKNKNGLLRNIRGFVLGIVDPGRSFTRINRRLENGNEQQAEFDGVQDKILSIMLWKYIQKHPKR